MNYDGETLEFLETGTVRQVDDGYHIRENYHHGSVMQWVAEDESELFQYHNQMTRNGYNWEQSEDELVYSR